MVTCGGRRTAVLSVAPAANLGVFDALILTGSPVCGLRSVRAARLDIENLPEPGDRDPLAFLGTPRHLGVNGWGWRRLAVP